MADERMEKENIENQAQKLKEEVAALMDTMPTDDISGGIDELKILYYLWLLWADFHLYITYPSIDVIKPPIVHSPLNHEDGSVESVFPIHDAGFRLSTSRAGEGFSANSCLNKYYNTIDKMVALLVERLKTGGVSSETEVRVAFQGHELGQRKAFESILNLEENVVVTNFDPGEWGDRYMKNVLELAERGYGLPKGSPRSQF